MKLSTVERAMQHLRHAEELLSRTREAVDHFPSTCDKPLERARMYAEAAREVTETLAGWVQNENYPARLWEITFGNNKTYRLHIKGRYWRLRTTDGKSVDNMFGIADYDDTAITHALAALQAEYGEYTLVFLGDDHTGGAE